MNKDIVHNKIAHDLAAKSYDTEHTEIFNDIEQQRLRKEIKELVRLAGPNPYVLDFGAGTGNVTRLFLEQNCRVLALDISEESLTVLNDRYKQWNNQLTTQVFDGITIPFPDHSFDIVFTYSVLHHIPDYIAAVREMARVVKKGGYLAIDHERSEESWNPGSWLIEYRKKTKKSLIQIIIKVIRTGDIVTWNFWKAVFIRVFINPRFRREGDIHVWPDDHIEWGKIYQRLKESHITKDKEKNYLLYNPGASVKEYSIYKEHCHDTKFYIGIKK